jgi:hypothetical protein
MIHLVFELPGRHVVRCAQGGATMFDRISRVFATLAMPKSIHAALRIQGMFSA